MRDKIGDYTIDESFRPMDGAFGTTFRATHDIFTDRYYAVKLIRNVDEHGIKDFFHEVRTLADLRLSGENIVLFQYAGFTDEREPYCAMEFCEGGDLDKLSLKLGGLNPADVVEIGRQASLGLMEAHRKKYIHRDIKPSNMMLAKMSDGHYGVKLIDFGLAKAVNNPRMSAGGMKGTPLFASPEQIKGDDLDHRSDLYSLGISLWYILLGAQPPPLSSDARREVEAEHVNFDRPYDFSDVHPVLRPILEGLTAKPLDQRFGDVERALEEFELALEKLGEAEEMPPDLDDLVSRLRANAQAKSAQTEFSPPVKSDTRSDKYYTELSATGLETPVGNYHRALRHDGHEVGIVGMADDIPESERDRVRRELKNLADAHIQAQQDSNYPEAIIRPIAFHWFSDDEVSIESEWIDGILFKELLQTRGRFRFREIVPLLTQIAEAADFCQQRNLPDIGTDDSQMVVCFANPVAVEDLDGMAPSEWPEHILKLTPLTFRDPTILASLTHTDKGDIKETLDTTDVSTALLGCSLLSIFSSRIYRMVSGKPVAPVAFTTRHGFSNTAALSAESNNLLRDRIAAGRTESGGSCLEFLQAICDNEGTAMPGVLSSVIHSATLPPTDYQVSTVVEPAETAASTPGSTAETPAEAKKKTPPEKRPGTKRAPLKPTATQRAYNPNLPTAKPIGPGRFRDPFTRDPITLKGWEIEPFKVITNERGDEFQLPQQIEPLKAAVSKEDPGVVFSPYFKSRDPKGRINFLATESAEDWLTGEKFICPVSRMTYILPAKLPRLIAEVDQGTPGRARSPSDDSEDGGVWLKPNQWTPGYEITLNGTPFVLPPEGELPPPLPVTDFDEELGRVKSPFSEEWQEIGEDEWKQDKVLSCRETKGLFQLPGNLPERVFVAEIFSGRDGQVINPHTEKVEAIPGNKWIGGEIITGPDGKTFKLPSAEELPDLRVRDLVDDRPGFVINPYTGEPVSLDCDEWKADARVEREGRSFFLPEKELTPLKEATVKEKEFDRIWSPYALDAEIPVTRKQWEKGKLFKCPKTHCLLRMPDDILPWMARLDAPVKVIGEEGHFQDPIANVRESLSLIRVGGEKWIENGVVTADNGNTYLLPATLPPLVARADSERPLEVISPYTGEWVPVSLADWQSDEVLPDPSDDEHRRTFRLPERLSAPFVTVFSGRPGLYVSPFDPRKRECHLPTEKWEPLIEFLDDEGRTVRLPDREELPRPEDAKWEERNFDLVIPRHANEPVAVPPDLWQRGSLLAGEDHVIFRLPDDLPDQPLTIGKRDVKTPEGPVGKVRSPYSKRPWLTIPGRAWNPGQLVLCEKESAYFRLPESLPPLVAVPDPSRPGVVEYPYAKTDGEIRNVPVESWYPGALVDPLQEGDQSFQLPDSWETLPIWAVEPHRDRPGWIILPGGVSYKLTRDLWESGGAFEFPIGNRKIKFRPRASGKPEELPVGTVRPGVFGKVRSPFNKKKGAKPIQLDEQDWQPGAIVECPDMEALFRLPLNLSETAPWLREAIVDHKKTGAEGWVFSPYLEKGSDPIRIPGKDWEQGARGYCQESGREFLLPEVPPLQATVVDGRKGLVRSPYADEDSGKVLEVAPASWSPGNELAGEGGHIFVLPPEPHLPPLEAGVIPDRPGIATSPFAASAGEFPVSLDDWEPDHEIPCGHTGRMLVLPGEDGLPKPILLEVSGEEEVTEDKHRLVESGRLEGRKLPVSMADWWGGKKLRFEGSDLIFRLPTEAEGLPVWAQEGRLVEGRAGELLCPYSGTVEHVPGPLWEIGQLIPCSDPDHREKRIRVPDPLPPMTAALVDGKPGTIQTPYVDESDPDAEAVHPIDPSLWKDGNVITCLATGRPLKLPDSLPLLRGHPDPKLPGKVASPFDPSTPTTVDPDHWKSGEAVKDAAGRAFELPPDLPEPRMAKSFHPSGAMITSPYGGKQKFHVDRWKSEAWVACQETGGIVALPRELPPAVGMLENPKLASIESESQEGVILSPFGDNESVAVPGKNWRPGHEVADGEGRKFVLPAKLPMLSAAVLTDRPGYVKSPYVEGKSTFRIEDQKSWRNGATPTCPKSGEKMVLPSDLEDRIPWEAVERYQTGLEDKRRRLIKFGGIGAAVLALVVAAAFAIPALTPDPLDRPKELLAEEKWFDLLEYLESPKAQKLTTADSEAFEKATLIGMSEASSDLVELKSPLREPLRKLATEAVVIGKDGTVGWETQPAGKKVIERLDALIAYEELDREPKRTSKLPDEVLAEKLKKINSVVAALPSLRDWGTGLRTELEKLPAVAVVPPPPDPGPGKPEEKEPAMSKAELAKADELAGNQASEAGETAVAIEKWEGAATVYEDLEDNRKALEMLEKLALNDSEKKVNYLKRIVALRGIDDNKTYETLMELGRLAGDDHSRAGYFLRAGNLESVDRNDRVEALETAAAAGSGQGLKDLFDVYYGTGFSDKKKRSAIGIKIREWNREGIDDSYKHDITISLAKDDGDEESMKWLVENAPDDEEKGKWAWVLFQENGDQTHAEIAATLKVPEAIEWKTAKLSQAKGQFQQLIDTAVEYEVEGPSGELEYLRVKEKLALFDPAAEVIKASGLGKTALGRLHWEIYQTYQSAINTVQGSAEFDFRKLDGAAYAAEDGKEVFSHLETAVEAGYPLAMGEMGIFHHDPNSSNLRALNVATVELNYEKGANLLARAFKESRELKPKMALRKFRDSTIPEQAEAIRKAIGDFGIGEQIGANTKSSNQE